MWLLALALAAVAASAPPGGGDGAPSASFSIAGALPKDAPPTLRGVFCRGVGPASEPLEPTGTFGDDAPKVNVVLSMDRPLRGRAWFTVLDAPGAVPGTRPWVWLGVPAEKPLVMSLEPPREGFFPGRYALVVALEGAPEQQIPFVIAPIWPVAERVSSASAAASPAFPFAIDIARSALGGTIASDVPKTKPEALIDGLPFQKSSDVFSAPRATPADVIFTLAGAGPAEVVGVAIDNTSPSIVFSPWDKRTLPKHVEIWTSPTAAGDDFVRAGGGRLQPVWGEQLVRLAPVAARRVKLRVRSNYGGTMTEFSALKVFATGAEAFLAQRAPLDLAAPALGGRVIWATSGGASVVALFDGLTGKAGGEGWSSAGSAGEDAGYLPQEFVLAFERGQRALVDRVVLHHGGHDAYWPRVVAIEVSDESPIDGFREVARQTLPKTAGPHTIAIGQEARFVKVRLLENQGGARTTLSEIEVIEGRKPGYVPILARPQADDGTSDQTAIAAPPSNEREPNDDRARARAVALGEVVSGTHAGGDVDVLHVTVPSAGALTVDLSGTPDIRSIVTLVDGSKPIGAHAPGDRAPRHDTFTWLTSAGEHWLEVRRAPSSVLLIWDTSGSMTESIKDLEAAVHAYIDTVEPDERVNLMRFAGDVAPLLPAFTSDRAALHAATKGKFWADGSTALYNAIARGIALLADEPGHRSIILMTDGSDSAHGLSSGALWRLVGETRVRIYAIGLGHDLTTYSRSTASSGDHVLKQLAHVTGGRSLFTEDSKDLAAFYAELGRDLRAPANWSLSVTASPARGALEVVATGERMAAVARPPDVLVVLDASGSMKRTIADGKGRAARPMIDVAKDTLSALVAALPAETRVALRVYGHRILEGRSGDCTDSELAVPLGPLDKKRLLGRITAIQALGTTPIAYALAQAATDLRGSKGEPLVVLVTDGLEECRGDAAKEVATLRRGGLKLRLEIIGFGLRDSAATRAMKALAESTGGNYRPAGDAAALAAAMTEALTVHWHAHDASGVELARGALGGPPVPLPEGHYRVVVDTAGQPVVLRDVAVRAAKTTRVALQKEGDALRIEVE